MRDKPEGTAGDDARDRGAQEGSETQQAKRDRVVEQDLNRMIDVGIEEQLETWAVDELVPMAAIDPSCGGNPIPIGEPELRELFNKSIHGVLA